MKSLLQHLNIRDLKWGKKSPVNIQTSSNNMDSSSTPERVDDSHRDGESDVGINGNTGRNLLSASCELSQTFFPTYDTSAYAL